jgi:biotin operon repressor
LEKAAQLLLKIPTPRDREIVKAYFGIGRFCAPSGDSLSEEFGMSKAGINKVVKKSIELLRA